MPLPKTSRRAHPSRGLRMEWIPGSRSGAGGRLGAGDLVYLPGSTVGQGLEAGVPTKGLESGIPTPGLEAGVPSRK